MKLLNRDEFEKEKYFQDLEFLDLSFWIVRQKFFKLLDSWTVLDFFKYFPSSWIFLGLKVLKTLSTS